MLDEDRIQIALLQYRENVTQAGKYGQGVILVLAVLVLVLLTLLGCQCLT